MTSAMRRLLMQIGATEDASGRLTRGNARAAEHLKMMGLVILVPISTGGAYIYLTDLGGKEHERLAARKESR